MNQRCGDGNESLRMMFTHRQVLFMFCVDEIKADEKCKGTVHPQMKIQSLSSLLSPVVYERSKTSPWKCFADYKTSTFLLINKKGSVSQLNCEGAQSFGSVRVVRESAHCSQACVALIGFD